MDEKRTTLTPPTQQPQLTQEDIEVEKIKQEEHKRSYNTPKFKMWLKCMLDKDSKKTYMNQTWSAIEAYNLDPATQYNVASVLGSKNIRRVKNLAAVHYAKMGVTYGTFLDLIWNKAVTTKDLKLLNWFSEIADLPLPKELPTNDTTNVSNTQYNYVEGGLNFNQFTDEQLGQFLESKRTTLARRGGEGITGTRETDKLEPVEVGQATPQTSGSNAQPEASEGIILGKSSR